MNETKRKKVKHRKTKNDDANCKRKENDVRNLCDFVVCEKNDCKIDERNE